MKHVIFLGDGMSDLPIPELGGRTPLMVAHTPNLDRMVAQGIGGWSLNTPPGYYPGSDVAILGVLGYDVQKGYTGRSPLEAAAMGVALSPLDMAFRCNLVTLGQEFSIMESFSAGHVSSQEGAELIQALQEGLGSEHFSFHPGVGYRHLLVWKGGGEAIQTIPPHDISDKPIAGSLPAGRDAAPILALMEASRQVLSSHPVNLSRAKRGVPVANSIWLWGQGRKPTFASFQDTHGCRGGMISAVDLIRGIAIHLGMTFYEVEGATGWIDTNYAGKAKQCLEGLAENDLMFVHVEAPDESGHAGRLDYKIQAIEDFDAKVVGPVLEGVAAMGAFRALALPDHPTPVALKTHNSDPVPYAMCGHGISPDANQTFDEGLLVTGSRNFNPGSNLMHWFLTGNK